MHLLAQLSMTFGVPGWTVSTFRDYYVPDQLAYLAIATDWAKGNSGSVEPFTETGTIYYPRLYYQFLGLVARVTGTTAATAWTMVGLTVQVLLVAMIGTTAVVLSRRAWAGLLAFLPFVIGTLAHLRAGGDTWYVQEGFHARLWGTFASIFTLNGDNAAMALGTTSLLTMVLIAAGRLRGRAALPLGLLGCFVIGGLSSVQTYSFLTTSYFLAYAAAVYALVHCRSRRWWLAGSSVILAALFGFGNALVGTTGPLVLLVLGMSPALPGLFLMWRQHGRWVLAAAACYALGALPQIVITGLGIVSGDAFLSFRTTNANDLGVPTVSGLVSALPVLIPVLWILAAGIHRRQPVWIALAAGGVLAWLVGASNDRWGADQEPYRMWLNFFALMGMLALPVALWVGRTYWEARRRRAVAAATVSVVALIGLAFPDFLYWRTEVTHGGYLSFTAPRMAAVTAAAAPALDGSGRLLLAGPCIDPLTLKAAWTGPVAHYNKGLAWPTHYDEIARLGTDVKNGIVDRELAAAADVGWVITDSACFSGVYPPLDPGTLVGAVDYTEDGRTGTIELWTVNAPGA